MKPNIFISYSRKDSAFVQRLASDLEQAGYDPWWDVADLRGGQAWAVEIEQHVRTCDAMVVVLSPDSNRSEWVGKEILKADQLKKPIIPIKWREGELPLPLIDRQFIDFGGQYAAAFQQLLRALPSLPTDLPHVRPVPIPEPWKQTRMLIYVVAGIALMLAGGTALVRWMEPGPSPTKPTAKPTRIIPSQEAVPSITIAEATTATHAARQTAIVAAQQTHVAETRAATIPEVVAQGTAHLVHEQSFDFLTGTQSQVGTLTGGDLYVLLEPTGGCDGANASFWSNNLPQRGGIDLGVMAGYDLRRVRAPTSESTYSRQCVPIAENHVYAYLQNQAGLVAIFRVTAQQEGQSVDLEYVVLADPGN